MYLKLIIFYFKIYMSWNIFLYIKFNIVSDERNKILIFLVLKIKQLNHEKYYYENNYEIKLKIIYFNIIYYLLFELFIIFCI